MKKLYRLLFFIFSHPLARRHKFISLYRFLNWQLSQFFSPGEKVVTFLNNIKMTVNKSDTGVTGSIYTGMHDFNEISFALHLLSENDSFADIGANVGFYSVVISKSIGCTSYAFEPISSTYDKLLKNIELNKLENKVISMNTAVGSEEGLLKMTDDLDTVNHIVLSGEDYKSKSSVKVIRLDKYFLDVPQPKLIKIDVEGYETEVIRGMENILCSDTLSAIIIELNGSGGRYGFDENLIHKKLLSHSFFPFRYDPFSRLLIEIDSFGPHNTIYARDLEFVKSRLNSAPPFKVSGEWI